MAEVRRNGCQLYQEQLIGTIDAATGHVRGLFDGCPTCHLAGQPPISVSQHPHQPPNPPPSTTVPMEDIMKELKEVKKSQDAQEILLKRLDEKKRRAIVLSEIDSDGWHMMLSEGGFTLDAASEWPADLTDRLLADQPAEVALIPPFQWSGENEPDQKDRYLAHLRTHLKLQLYREAEVVSMDDKKSFLSVSDRRLLFDIKGTTDVAVVHRGYIAAREESQGVQAVIELKKECNPKATRQTIGQLIAADLISRYSPLGVLTDLRDEWHFYWLEGRTIKHLRPPAGPNVRRDAFLFLRLALAPGFVAGGQLAAANAFVDALPVSVGKRRKLSPVKEDRPRRDEAEESEMHRHSGADSEDADEEDRQMVLYRQVRKMVRRTPWLREICREPLCLPISVEACNMFG